MCIIVYTDYYYITIWKSFYKAKIHLFVRSSSLYAKYINLSLF